MTDYKIPMQRVMTWQIGFLMKVQAGKMPAFAVLNENQKILLKNGFVTHSVDEKFTITENGIDRIAELIEWKKFLGSNEEEPIPPKWPWSFENTMTEEGLPNEQLDFEIETTEVDTPSIEPTSQLIEGARYYVQVTAYERNLDARRKCIEHYGLSCSVCNFNFEKVYGAAAKTYIHVHHLTPLASIQEAYVVDSIEDLRPVCANCHAVIHLNQPPYSIEEVKTMLFKAKATL